MGGEAGAATEEGSGAGRSAAILFSALQFEPRPRRPVFLASAVIQVLLWAGLAWLLNVPPQPDYPVLSSPMSITWLAAPEPSLPPPPTIARRRPPVHHISARVAVRRLHARSAPPLRLPRALPPAPVVSEDPPSVRNALPVTADIVPIAPVAQPPQPRSTAAVKVGSFAAADPPGAPAPAAYGPVRTGLFRDQQPASTAIGDEMPQIGTFGAAPEHPPVLRAASHPAVSAAPEFGFGASAAPRAPIQPRAARPPLARYEPPLILSKPTPRYTAQARALHLQGDVVLRVILTATGAVRVLGIVHGLGAGLDRAAQDSVRAIRFRPARRDGHPVDATVLVRVSFRLAE